MEKIYVMKLDRNSICPKCQRLFRANPRICRDCGKIFCGACSPRFHAQLPCPVCNSWDTPGLHIV